jgi:hypothetical protein
MKTDSKDKQTIEQDRLRERLFKSLVEKSLNYENIKETTQ